MKPPAFFEDVRTRAAQRWAQLDGDPELAGPWHQLFKQVQSPRHVLSELLQNADDTKASNAWARIEDDEFIFEHDGIDFNEDDFASLCKFGYSNKRSLHTIGFRGIGFKSTFSLGSQVKVASPTISILFNRDHFTEPIWVQRDGAAPKTEIRVKIQDDRRAQELEKNMREWAESPLSLLFFRSIKQLTIQDDTVQKRVVRQGPVKGSQWVKLAGGQKDPYLLVRSEPTPFPDEAMDEIRQERMGVDDFELPPCEIDLVVGVEDNKRLYVVLPTEVSTELPFAINAPFVQDPARLKIKDPEISPTNRWLLERAGEFAAQCMLEWLGKEDLGLEDRCKAYSMFPDVDRDNESLEGVCSTTCEVSFQEVIEEEEYLLTEGGKLAGKEQCISVDAELYDIWKPSQISTLLDDDKRPVLCRYVGDQTREAFQSWGVVEAYNQQEVSQALEKSHPPKPDSWAQLMLLWDYLSDRLTWGWRYSNIARRVKVIPVQGESKLYSASEVVRLGEEKLLRSDDDWEFLSEYVRVVNPYWPRFITKQLSLSEKDGDELQQARADNTSKVLSSLGLANSSDVSQVIERVAQAFFDREDIPEEECIRLAQIAAALGASVPDTFQYITCDDRPTQATYPVLADSNHDLDLYVDDEWYETHVLHEIYSKKYKACSEAQWENWIRSGRSKLKLFVPLEMSNKAIDGRDQIRREVKVRGGLSELEFHYKYDRFVIEDWDFKADHWKYWKSVEMEQEDFWGKLLTRIINTPNLQWDKALSSKAYQVATTGRRKQITQDELAPSWIMKFRELPCLQDTRGFYRVPTELLRRTPETEALLDVELFVRAEIDTEANRPLLIQLGVRDTPTGPEKLLDRLRALSKVDEAPLDEIVKWYRRLDDLVPNCSTDELSKVQDAFRSEALIFTDSREWSHSGSVFLNSNEEDVPGALVIHESARQLNLWPRMGVVARPSVELAVAWLKELPKGKRLTENEQSRVKALISRYPERVWNECGAWLNLEGEWVSTKELSYRITMQSLIPWANLFKKVKVAVADLKMLSAETSNDAPFSSLPTLASSVEERIEDGTRGSLRSIVKPWLNALGKVLSRVDLDDKNEAIRIREQGIRMSGTRWQIAKGLKSIPYIDGSPAGTTRKVDVVWKDDSLFVEDRDVARLFKAIAQELARPFDRADIAEAIKASIERSPEFIQEYLESNFTLLPPDELPAHAQTAEEVTESRAQVKAPIGDANKPMAESGSKESVSEEPVPEKYEEGLVGSDTMDDEPLTEEAAHEPSGEPDEEKSPSGPRFYEVFAESQGFEQIPGEPYRFRHGDGSLLQRNDGGAFAWGEYSAEGELLQSYWLREHCLQKNPLKIDVVIWNLCTEDPENYSLVLIDDEGRPVVLPGIKLAELVESEVVTLHPAEYRIVWENE